MLLEKWFRSEAQQEIRVQLQQASDNVDHLLTKLKCYEDRLTILRDTVKELTLYIHHHESPPQQLPMEPITEIDPTGFNHDHSTNFSRQQEEVSIVLFLPSFSFSRR